MCALTVQPLLQGCFANYSFAHVCVQFAVPHDMVSQVSLGSFFKQPSLQTRLNKMPSMDLEAPRVLLFGQERCGKTSLLFQYAFQLACEGQEVWILCDQLNLDQSPPLLPFGVDQNHEALGKIKFKYISDLDQLKNFGACLHLCPNPPAAVLVDNLSQLTRNTRLSDKRAQDVAITKALAFLVDGLDHIREHTSLEVMLLVSTNTGREGVLHNMYLLHRWFPVMLAISGGPGPGQMLTLQVSPQSTQVLPAAAARAAVHYSLTQSYINVESVQDGGFG